MAKDLTITSYGFLDKPGSAVVDWPRAIEFVITEGAATQNYLSGIANILVTLDVDANYMEIRVGTALIYKYQPGDTYGTGTVGSAQAMYISVLGDMVQ